MAMGKRVKQTRQSEACASSFSSEAALEWCEKENSALENPTLLVVDKIQQQHQNERRTDH